MKEQKQLLAVNDAPILIDAGPNSNPVGRICAANESRFASTFYSEPLTAYTVGWRDPENLDQLIEDLFPSVQVGRRFEFKAANNNEAFLSETDDIRAIGSAFKRIEFTGTSVNQKTHNKGLTIRVDHDDEVGDNWREFYTQMLMQRLLRNDFRRGLSILDAASTNVAKVWDATKNPDGDMRAALKAGTDASGVRGNIVILGQAANDLRLDVYEAQNTPYAGRAASMTPDQLAQKLMVDLVRVVKARYQSSASAKSAVVPSVVYSYLALKGVSKDDPTNVKRFVTPARGGKWGVYVQEHEKFTDISVEQYSNTVITSTLGIRKLTVTAT
jgi:hypothetical protein